MIAADVRGRGKYPQVARSWYPVLASRKFPSLVRRVVGECEPRAVNGECQPVTPPPGGLPSMKSARENMDIVAAYQQVGTYRGAAAIAGPRIRLSGASSSVRRLAARRRTACGVAMTTWSLSGRGPGRGDEGADLGKAAAARGKGGGVCGVGAEFRRRVAEAKRTRRRDNHRGRRTFWRLYPCLHSIHHDRPRTQPRQDHARYGSDALGLVV